MNSSWEKCATEFDPDPDIAGIGVVTAFITASCLAILSISLYLAIARSGLNIVEAPSVRPPPRFHFVESVNPIDDWVRRNISDPFVKLFVRSRWIRAHINQLKRGLYSFVITLADTQLVTGMAILCTAIIQLHREEISVYHFQTATNLAWLTSGVHILTLYAIRVETNGGLSNNPIHYHSNNRHYIRKAALTSSLGADMIYRIFGMLVLAGLLLYCTFISGAGGWDDYDERKANCAIGMKKSGSPLSWMIASFVLLIQGYTIQCFSLWPAMSTWWMNLMKNLSNGSTLGANKNEQKRRWWWLIFMPLYYAFNSEALGILLFDGVLWFGLGVWWIQAERIYVLGAWEGMESESDIEGVSQVLCLLILVVPFLQALRMYHEHSRTLPRELDLFRGHGACDSGQTSQEVLGRRHDMDSDDTEAPIRLGSVTRTAYPV